MEKRWIVIGFILLVILAGVLIYLISLVSSNGFGLLSSLTPGCVGVIPINGEIATGSSSSSLFGSSTLGSDEIVGLIDEAESRENIKAVVFEINSPGGSVVASREIYEEIEGMKKPKVAYFREVAASGGYYVGVASDYIVANPDTLTGSIGVRATLVDMSDLLQKVGVNFTVIKSGELKDIGSEFRPLTPKERQIFESIVSEIFEEFKNDVVKHRGKKLNQEKFEEVLDARVLTGRQALEVGLVDEIGNKKSAIKKAGELAGLGSEPSICTLEVKRDILQELFGAKLNGIFGAGPNFNIRIT